MASCSRASSSRFTTVSTGVAASAAGRFARGRRRELLLAADRPHLGAAIPAAEVGQVVRQDLLEPRQQALVGALAAEGGEVLLPFEQRVLHEVATRRPWPAARGRGRGRRWPTASGGSVRAVGRVRPGSRRGRRPGLGPPPSGARGRGAHRVHDEPWARFRRVGAVSGVRKLPRPRRGINRHRSERIEKSENSRRTVLTPGVPERGTRFHGSLSSPLHPGAEGCSLSSVGPRPASRPPTEPHPDHPAAPRSLRAEQLEAREMPAILGPTTIWGPVNPYNLATADLNKDGYLDVIAPSLDGGVQILRNNGNGTFPTIQSYSTGSGHYNAAAADFNGDTHVDIALTNFSDVRVLLNDGSGGSGCDPPDRHLGPGLQHRRRRGQREWKDRPDRRERQRRRRDPVPGRPREREVLTAGHPPPTDFPPRLDSRRGIRGRQRGWEARRVRATMFSGGLMVHLNNGSGTFLPGNHYLAGGSGSRHLAVAT